MGGRGGCRGACGLLTSTTIFPTFLGQFSRAHVDNFSRLRHARDLLSGNLRRRRQLGGRG